EISKDKRSVLSIDQSVVYTRHQTFDGELLQQKDVSTLCILECSTALRGSLVLILFYLSAQLSEETMALRIDIEALVSRRRYADHTWDSEQDDAPLIKRIRCEGNPIITKDSDLQVRPDCDMDMDINCNEYPMNAKGTNDVEKAQHAHCQSPTRVECFKTTSKVEKREESVVQVFPQTIPLYEHRMPVNNFSYCDRSAFSRHLFF
ncbi:hypothetical protein GCK32_005673, partial [Trichostrongylus colubriformis]